MNSVFVLLLMLVDPTQTTMTPLVAHPKFFVEEKNCTTELKQFMDHSAALKSNMIYSGKCVKMDIKFSIGENAK